MAYERRNGGPKPEGDGTFFLRNFMLNELREASRPLLVFEGTSVPAASLWSGAKLWIDELVRVGMEPGDRIVLSLPPGPAFVQLLLASLWDEYTLILSPPEDGRSAAELAGLFDARFTVGPTPEFDHVLEPFEHGPGSSLELRDFNHTLERTPNVSLIHSTDSRNTNSFLGFSLGSLLSQIRWFPEGSASVSFNSWFRADTVVSDLLVPLLDNQFLVVANEAEEFERHVRQELSSLESTAVHLSEGNFRREESFPRLIPRGESTELYVRTDSRGFGRMSEWSPPDENRVDDVHLRLASRDTCGPLAYRSLNSNEVFYAGEEVRNGSSRTTEVLTHGAARMQFDSRSDGLEFQSVPRWVKTNQPVHE